MIIYKNNSDAVIILLHEIYGLNQFIQERCNYYADKGFDVICPNLINKSVPFDYSQEGIAYQHFVKNIGIEAAFQAVKELIMGVRSDYQNVIVIGYSIGATIAWLCSSFSCNGKNLCDGTVCYYGSRIRDLIDIVPKNLVLLLFAKEEISFNVEEFKEKLLERRLKYQLENQLSNVKLQLINGQHGFCDPYNENYSELSCIEADRLAHKFLEKLGTA